MKSQIPGAVAGALLVATFSFFSERQGATAQIATRGTAGAHEAGRIEEKLAWKTLQGDSRRASLQRVLLKVPASYGQLTHVTAGEMTCTLWFTDQAGTLRNVFLGTSLNLVTIEREGIP